MLVIDKNNLEYFTKVCKFATATGRTEFLWQQLMYLHHFSDQEIPETRKYWCRTCDFGYVSHPDFTNVPNCPSCATGRPQLWSAINKSDRGGTAASTRCRLSYDSAPGSFGFVIDRWSDDGGWRFMFNGGLIYHGSQAGWETKTGYIIKEGEGIPTFSVRFGDDSENPWSIHT